MLSFQTAMFSWVNVRLALLPDTHVLLVMGLVASLVAIGAKAAMPEFCVRWPRSPR
jgi:monovalent cation:H+ antiporter, CPA1 family